MITSPLRKGQSLYVIYRDSPFIVTLRGKYSRHGCTYWFVTREELRGNQRILHLDIGDLEPEGVLRKMKRVCTCRRHPSPDGWCELPIDDKEFVSNDGLCAWCHGGHSTAKWWLLFKGSCLGALRSIRWALVNRAPPR